MRRLAALGLAALALASGARAATAIVHARAYTVTAAGTVEDATVVLDGGRIVSVTAHGAVPNGARVVDARGQPVTPGLVSAATQLGLSEVNGASDTDDRAAGAQAPIGAALDVSYAFDANSTQLPVARADGLTRALILPSPGNGVFAGQGAVVRLLPPGGAVERARAAELAVIARPDPAKLGSRAVAWGLIRNALDEARRMGTPADDPRQRLNSRPDLEALRPVLSGATPLVIQADRAADIRQALVLGREEKVRVAIWGGAEAWSVAGELAAARVPVILDPQMDLPQTFDQIGARADNAVILARAGVPIAIFVSGNTVYLSYTVGEAIRWGAGLAVANGLPYDAALAAITRSPAAIFGMAGGAGTLAPGADADVVIWDGDPLEPASAPVAVFVAGEPVSLVSRQTLLRDRYAPHP